MIIRSSDYDCPSVDQSEVRFLPLLSVRTHHKRAYFNPLILGLLIDVLEQRDAVCDDEAGAAHL